MSDKGRVLVVEDDEDVRRGLTIRLKSKGYEVVIAEDAVGAVSVAQQQRPDLILLDLGLPGGDGFTVMERLRYLAPVAMTPVIVLTARDPSSNQERALSSGAVAYFQKPAHNEELLKAVEAALNPSSADHSDITVGGKVSLVNAPRPTPLAQEDGSETTEASALADWWIS